MAPGIGPGVLTSGGFSLSTGAHLGLQLGGTNAGLYDQLKVNGAVTLAGDAQVSLFGGFTPAVGNTFFVILNDGSDAVSGTFSNAASNLIIADGWQYQVNYAANGDGGTTSNDVSLTATAPVPEPTTYAMLAAGIAVLIAFQQRRRRWRAKRLS